MQNILTAKIREILETRTYTFKNIRLRDVEVNEYKRPRLVIATIFSPPQEINGRQVKLVQEFLEKELAMPLELKLRIIPRLEVSAEDEPDANGKETERFVQ